MVLDPTWRIPALVQHVSNLATDVICLQEVELETFAALKSRLISLGYAAQYSRKTAGKPDGCATFYRQQTSELVAVRVLQYADGVRGQANSGHIALIVLLRMAGGVVGVANTHLTWDPPGTAGTAKFGDRQVLQLLHVCQTMAPSCNGWLICGDLNATPDSEIVTMIERAGFRYSHAGLAHAYTCKANTEVKMIDYLFYSPEFCAEPQDVVQISNRTVLPSAEQPSDHVPIVARFTWS